MNKSTTWVAISQKIAELDAQIAGNNKEDKSVGRLKRQARALRVISALMEYAPEDFSLGASLDKDLDDMITPKKGKKIVFDIKEGDSVIELLDKYKDVKDGYHRILAQAEQMGLKMVGGILTK